jgi:hypothetical protein
MNAERAAITDTIRWEENGNDPPKIDVKMLGTKSFPPDPVVQERVDSHQAILKELDGARLFAVADCDPTTVRTIRQAVNGEDDTRNGDATAKAGHADAAATPM